MLALGLSAFWAVPAALPASAQAVVEVDEDVIVGILKSEGLKAEIGYDEGTGAPYVATYWEKLKANFEVRLDACDEDGFFCEVMVFNAGFFFDKEPTRPPRTRRSTSGTATTGARPTSMTKARCGSRSRTTSSAA